MVIFNNAKKKPSFFSLQTMRATKTEEFLLAISVRPAGRDIQNN